MAETGQPFIPGGDSQTYHATFIDMLNGSFHNFFGRYEFYLYIGWKFYGVIYFLTSSTSYIYFAFLSLFIGANTAPLLYKVGVNRFHEKTLIYACLMTCFFPSLLQINVVILRESFIIAPFIYSVYLSINQKSIKNTLLFVATLVFMLNIRLEIGGMAFLFYILYNYVFISKNKNDANGIIRIMLFIVALVFSLQFINSLNDLDYWSPKRQMAAYDQRSQESMAGASISRSLRQGGIIGRLVLFFYCAFVPVPPHVIYFPFLHNFLLCWGNIVWYFVLPVSVFEITKTIRKKNNISSFSLSFFVVFVSAILIISLTSLGSERHKLYLYPIIFLFFCQFVCLHSKRENLRVFTPISIVYLILIVLYLIMKM
jgi:hypothetical protein